MTTRDEFVILIAEHRRAAVRSVEGPENMIPWTQRPIVETSYALLVTFDAMQAKIDALAKALEDIVAIYENPYPEHSPLSRNGWDTYIAEQMRNIARGAKE